MKESKAVLINLDGEEYRLCYTMRALSKFKQLTGHNLMSGDVDFTDPDSLTAVVWAGLITHYKEFDGVIDSEKPEKNIKTALETISSKIDILELTELSASIARALGIDKKIKSGAEEKKVE